MEENNKLIFSNDGTILVRCSAKMDGEVKLSEGIKGIYQGAFKNCTRVESVVLPESLEVIGSNAFEGCAFLMNINIPNGVTYIGEQAFKDCFRLGSITLPASLKKLKNGTFQKCASLEKVTMADPGVQSIDKDCFKNCWNLKEITIPSSVVKMEEAFIGCDELKTLVVKLSGTHRTSTKWIEAVHAIQETERVELERNTGTRIKAYQFGGKNALTTPGSLWLRDSTKYIDHDAFNGSVGLEEISIPGSVKKISSRAFKECINLSKVTIHEGVVRICESAFQNCISLEEISLPRTITSVSRNAFRGCKKLRTVNVYSATEITGEAFVDCPHDLRVIIVNE